MDVFWTNLGLHDKKMEEDFEYQGKWSFPNKPENKYSGKIIYRSHEFIHLILFSKPQYIDFPDGPNGRFKIDYIDGIAEDLQISLKECTLKSESYKNTVYTCRFL